MDNPYQPPCSNSSSYPHVEVVLRSAFVGRNYEQIYRFNCHPHDPDLLREKIVTYFLGHNTRMVSSSDGHFEFERLCTSRWVALTNPSERMRPQTIHIALERTATGTYITCHYRVRTLIPTLLIAPHQLQVEVRELAVECDAN